MGTAIGLCIVYVVMCLFNVGLCLYRVLQNAMRAPAHWHVSDVGTDGEHNPAHRHVSDVGTDGEHNPVSLSVNNEIACDEPPPYSSVR